MEKIWKIWHRGNFSPNVVIYETGCGNFPWKNLVTLKRDENVRV
jgi:hypothetical protein